MFFILIIVGIWVFVFWCMRLGGGMGSGGGNIFDIGKFKVKLFEKGFSDVIFKDVAGLEEVKVEVKEVVDFLKNLFCYIKLGVKIFKGVLFVGFFGIGKILLVRVVVG